MIRNNRSRQCCLFAAGVVVLGVAVAAASSAHAAEPARPEITAMSPDHGPLAGGTNVVIEGEHFTGVTAVNFGGLEAESVTVDSDTEITAVPPAPAPFGPREGIVVNLWVTGPGGSSSYNSVLYSFGPVINEMTPESGPGSGGTAVTIFGYGLEETSAVTFGSVPAEGFTVNSDGSITAISPHPAPEESIVDVTATTPEGTTGVYWTPDASLANDFIYGPTVTRVIPDMGPEAGAGTKVTILGTGFKENAFRCLCGPFVGRIMFGDVELRCGFPFGAGTASCKPLEFVVNSDREITAIVPPGHGTVGVSVGTAGGLSPASPEAQFTYPPDRSPPGGSEEPQLLLLMSCVVSTRAEAKAVGFCSSRSFNSDEESTLPAGPVTVSLRRGKMLYATGSARVHRQTTQLFLKPARPVRGGRYKLVLSHPATDGGKRWSRRELVVLH
jgi:hypothetical protein